jgi:hypothetical protein
MPPARKRERIVPQKVREAVEHMYATPGATLQTTAEHVRLTVYKLRYLMTLPHVARWLLLEKQARLQACVPGNIDALVSIRDDRSNQQASVHAVKQLEAMLDNVSERTGLGRAAQQNQRVPGLSIVLIQKDGGQLVAYEPPKPAPLIESTAIPEAVLPVPTDSDNDT